MPGRKEPLEIKRPEREGKRRALAAVPNGLDNLFYREGKGSPDNTLLRIGIVLQLERV